MVILGAGVQGSNRVTVEAGYEGHPTRTSWAEAPVSGIRSACLTAAIAKKNKDFATN